MKGCLNEIDDAVAFVRDICLWIWSLLSVISSFDDFAADLGEKLIYRMNVLIGRSFNCEFAIWYILREVLRENFRYGSVPSKVTLASHDDDEHLWLLALKMIVPLTKLVERIFIIDGIAEDSNSSIFEEEVSQVVDGCITSSIPNIKLNFLIVYCDELCVIL